MGTNISTAMVVVTLATGLWWGFARRRRQNLLRAFSIAALALAVATLVVEGLRWQLVPWQVLALAVAAAAALRRWRPGRSRRWRRVVGRGVLVVGLTLGGLALLTASCRRCRSRRGRIASAAWSSAGRTTSAPRRLPLTRRTAVRSSLRRGTRPMRRRAGRFRISRRRAVCRRRSTGFRPSCSPPSVASRRTRPRRPRSVPRSDLAGGVLLARAVGPARGSTRLSAPTSPAAATWSWPSASPTSQRCRSWRAARSSVRRSTRT